MCIDTRATNRIAKNACTRQSSDWLMISPDWDTPILLYIRPYPYQSAV